MARYLAFKMVYDFCRCSHTNTPGISSVRLLLTTHSSTCLTAQHQIRQVLCKSSCFLFTKTFAHSTDLTEYTRTHTGEKLTYAPSAINSLQH